MKTTCWHLKPFNIHMTSAFKEGLWNTLTVLCKCACASRSVWLFVEGGKSECNSLLLWTAHGESVWACLWRASACGVPFQTPLCSDKSLLKIMSNQSGARTGEYQYRLGLLQLESETFLSFPFLPLKRFLWPSAWRTSIDVAYPRSGLDVCVCICVLSGSLTARFYVLVCHCMYVYMYVHAYMTFHLTTYSWDHSSWGTDCILWHLCQIRKSVITTFIIMLCFPCIVFLCHALIQRFSKTNQLIRVGLSARSFSYGSDQSRLLHHKALSLEIIVSDRGLNRYLHHVQTAGLVKGESRYHSELMARVNGLKRSTMLAYWRRCLSVGVCGEWFTVPLINS